MAAAEYMRGRRRLMKYKIEARRNIQKTEGSSQIPFKRKRGINHVK